MLVSAVVLVGAGAAAAREPDAPRLHPLPETLGGPAVTVTWDAVEFSRRSNSRVYEVLVQDETAGGAVTQRVPQTAGAATESVTLVLAQGRAYRISVRAIEARCESDDDESDDEDEPACETEVGPFSASVRVRVAAPAIADAGPVPAAPVGGVAAALAPQPAALRSPGLLGPRVRPSARLQPLRLMAPQIHASLSVGRPLALRWRPDPRASYYNVQLYRGARKVVSTWPSVARVRLAKGRLRPGPYRLLVWSGIGSRERKRYAPRPWLSVPLVMA